MVFFFFFIIVESRFGGCKWGMQYWNYTRNGEKILYASLLSLTGKYRNDCWEYKNF